MIYDHITERFLYFIPFRKRVQAEKQKRGAVNGSSVLMMQSKANDRSGLRQFIDVFRVLHPLESGSACLLDNDLT